jgi:hypothetical protein
VTYLEHGRNNFFRSVVNDLPDSPNGNNLQGFSVLEHWNINPCFAVSLHYMPKMLTANVIRIYEYIFV